MDGPFKTPMSPLYTYIVLSWCILKPVICTIQECHPWKRLSWERQEGDRPLVPWGSCWVEEQPAQLDLWGLRCDMNRWAAGFTSISTKLVLAVYGFEFWYLYHKESCLCEKTSDLWGCSIFDMVLLWYDVLALCENCFFNHACTLLQPGVWSSE